MKAQTKLLLKEAYDFCKKENRSLAYTVEYMCVFANVDENCAANWLGKYSGDYETKTK